MKNIITLAVSLFSLTIFAQVGINNNTPKATLDITAQTTNGSKPEGLLPPRLTGDQIQAGDAQYTAAQAGIIIYATAAATAPSTKTANITAAGYYFYDGSAWQKITSGAAVADATTAAKGIVQLAGDLSGTAASPAIAANAVTSAKILDGTVANADLATGTGGIYKGSGSLSGNTTVTQGANTLAFTSTATNGFSVDGTTLSVDAANDRVGIGTNVPSTKLHIQGDGTNSALRLENTPVVTGPYSALGINDITGNVGTYSPGTAPILIVGYSSASALDGNPGLTNDGDIALWRLNNASKTIVLNTLGATLGTDAVRDFISVPSPGLYRVEANGTFLGSVASTGVALNISFSSAPNGSTTYTNIQRNRLGTVQTLALQPFYTAAYINVAAANAKIGLAEILATPCCSGTTSVSLSLGSGITYAVVVTITKL